MQGKRRKDFFSEEKKQRTFDSGAGGKNPVLPGSRERRRNKSLLVLFFRKELPSFTQSGSESGVCQYGNCDIIITPATDRAHVRRANIQ
jgi:hypothetical protein